jgi:FkbM family methyltransferase
MMTTAPEFDDTSPWGRYLPTADIARRLALAHRLPQWLSPLVKPLRRPVKYRVSTPMDVQVWGLKLRLMPRGNLSELKLIAAPQLFDAAERALLASCLEPGRVFVDVGANAGAYSFWAHRCMQGQGRIVAVEPDPEMRRRLAFNRKTNRLDDIEVCPLALSDHEGEAELNVNLRQRGQNTLESAQASRSGDAVQRIVVQVTTLLALLRERGITRVDALKIDIEGHETPVIRHFLQYAPASMWPALLISELHPHVAAELEPLLAQCGYRRVSATRLNGVFERAP